MRALLDACVLYPTVMREMLLGVAAEGGFTPLWSARINEEWARAAGRLGTEAEGFARGEIAVLNMQFPQANIAPAAELEQRLWLPDSGDIHVLAAAIEGKADVIVTANAKDFPRGLLAEEGVSRADPDAFLLGHFEATPARVEAVASRVLQEAQRLSGEDWQMRALLKKARLPRLGKALS